MHARKEELLHASQVARPRIWTGLLLNESYKVASLVEQGITTELYDGIELSTGEPVALKILLPRLAEDARTRALFLDEARALGRLTQPGLLRYRLCARDPQYDLTYIVTDAVGIRMSSRLAIRKLGEEDIAAFTKRLALALAAAHSAGVIHRGLRPHAIALPQGRLSDATITDFNLISTAAFGLSSAFDAMVDRDYCAPEQVPGGGEGAVVGPWTDVYSLALLVLSAAGGSQSDLSVLPRNLRPVFERMLETKPARRFQSMDEVVKELDLALTSAPLRSFIKRAQSAGLARLRRVTEREAPPDRPSAAPAPWQTRPAPTPTAEPAPSLAADLRQAQTEPKPAVKPVPAAAPAKEPAPTKPSLPPLPASMRPAPPPSPPKPVSPVAGETAPVKPSLPPLLEALRPAPPPLASSRAVPLATEPTPVRPARSPLPAPLPPMPTRPTLAKFHAAHASIGLGGFARRFAVAVSALLLASSPWIVQTSLREGTADASVVAPTKQIQTAKADQIARAAAALPKGRVYGTDNANSRITLRFHRPARVSVHARQRLVFNRAVQPGDTYRAPRLAELSVTTEDAGAIEVLFEGASAGFVGEAGKPVEKASLTQMASLAPPTNRTNDKAVAAQARPAKPAEPGLTTEQADALAASIAAIDEAATPAAPALIEDLGIVADDPAASSVPPAPAEQAIASLAPPPAPAPPPATTQTVMNDALPEPPATVEVTPSRVAAVASVPGPAATAAPQQVTDAQPTAQPEERRSLLQRLFTRNSATAPAPRSTDATALILAPAISKEAADRAKAASDMAKAARDAAKQKADLENRRRDRAYFNSTLGINSRF